MSRWSRLVCIWCLALVLPLRGLAASCLLPFAATQAPSSSLAALSSADAAVHPCHGAASGATAVDEDVAADSTHRCSACAACCVGAALPAIAPLLGAPGPVREAQALTPLRLRSMVIAGPERPPRDAGC